MTRAVGALLALIALSGCATSPAVKDPRDPFEGFNRAMYQFNDSLDRAVLKPVAEGYQRVMPTPASRAVTNVFSNLDDVIVFVNDLFQAKGEQALHDFLRFTFNSSFGLLGLIDIATPMGLPKHEEDFGQTLAVWGVGSGPYVVLPFFGPSTVRDGGSLLVDGYFDPVYAIDDDATRWGIVGLRAVDKRAGLLRAGRILDEAALDPYAFLRDAWLQRRRNLIHDGNPPEQELDPFDPLLFDLEGEPAPAPDAAP